jgi:hypothetical protein
MIQWLTIVEEIQMSETIQGDLFIATAAQPLNYTSTKPAATI